MALKIRKEDALNYHTQGQPGKIEVVPTKPLSSQMDLALAYSPGVAEPCLEIEKNPEDAYKYTSKGNLVAVISNGTAVLGLGNIGALASKPVMEGKAVLFKKYAGIDSFDIEVDCTDPDEFIRIVKALEPTFGGVNLEDIKAPECFKIEQTLRKEMKIPIMHDDQHGTAIISAAGLLSAVEVAGKKLNEVIIVVNGAGASAISCTKLYIAVGAKKENIIMLDSKGVIRKGAENLDPSKAEFATDRNLSTLEDAVKDCDVFIGLSKGNILTPEMVLSMANNPIVFALANPTPEIDYNLAMATRKDIIMATGRSDHPNQVNNVLGFPYIFRGALDVRATEINEAMKLAAVKALSELAHEPVPDVVAKAYGVNKLTFSKDYLIPKPLDPRLINRISVAVAKAAIDSGVARNPINDWEAYELELNARLGIDNRLVNSIINEAKKEPKRVVFAEADNFKILKAAEIVKTEGIGIPILLGDTAKINKLIEEHQLELEECTIIDTRAEETKDKVEEYGNILHEKRKRKGITAYEGKKLMRDRNYFGAMMVEMGEADALISGLTKDYTKILSPALQVIGPKKNIKRVAGMYIILNKKGPFFFADTTVNINPDAETLVEIIGLTAEKVRTLNMEPRVAVLSFSNFGSAHGDTPRKTSTAVALAKAKFPELIIDGEMQANFALNPSLLKENYPFSDLAEKGANTLIFPNLSSGNIAYKMLQEIGSTEVIGPILMGMNKPVHILQLGSSVREIVNMVALAVVEAQK